MAAGTLGFQLPLDSGWFDIITTIDDDTNRKISRPESSLRKRLKCVKVATETFSPTQPPSLDAGDNYFLKNSAFVLIILESYLCVGKCVTYHL